MDHIELNLGNVVMISAVSLLAVGATLGTIHFLGRRNVPALSATSRGVADFITATTTKDAA